MRKLYICLLLIIVTPLFAQVERPYIHASDVVFMYTPGDPTQYDAYQGTVAGWAGRARSREEQDVQRYNSRVAEAHKRGMKYCGSVDFLVDFAGYIDFRPDTFMEAVCRDLDDKPLQVPWLWDHKHKGHPSYWFCTNNPEYVKYLKDQAERACLAPIDGLHIDDYSGTSHCSEFNGGCFCESCREGFREYLKARYVQERYNEWGIEDIDNFDYREFLRSKGISTEQYKRERHKVPLIREFQVYQNEQMKERIREVFEHAERIRGQLLLRSINSSANRPRTLIPAPIIDYFCGEVGHGAAAQKAPFEPVFVYKVVEALNRRQTATASGQDWAWIKANEKPGLVRMWIAQAYSFGSVFMVPHNQWCYTQELGTHWWQGKPEDFAYLYRFVREQKALLDGANNLASLALLYSNDKYSNIVKAAEELTKANIPYTILVQPDEEIVLPEGALQKESFQHVYAFSAQAEGVETWPGVEGLPEDVRRQVHVEGADNVRISLRSRPDGKVICHVLNQNYDPQADGINTVNINLKLDKPLLQQAGLKKTSTQALVLQPGKESMQTNISEDADSILFALPNIELWAMVVIE